MKEMQSQQTQAPASKPTGEWDQFTRQPAVVILMLGVLFLLVALRPLLNLLGITGIVILILSYPVNMLTTKRKMRRSVAVMVVFIPLVVLLLIIFGNVLGRLVDDMQS